MSQAIDDVIAERQRQIDIEGWSNEHDDQHRAGDLAVAGACYAAFAVAEDSRVDASLLTTFTKNCWPWGREWWKPKIGTPRRDLVRAAALIVAEIDRLDRESLRSENEVLATVVFGSAGPNTFAE